MIQGTDPSPQLTSKLPNVGTSIFTIMSKLALEQNAINLSQGFPDFSCSPHLIDLVSYYMKMGHNQYAPMQGIIQLREKIAEKTAAIYRVEYNPDTEITITSGATEALYSAITAVVRPGDEVIIFEPAYDSYAPVVELNGGICRFIPLNFPDYSIDWGKVSKSVNAKTRLIIINSPHNPTGSVISKADLQNLEKIMANTDAYIIADEVYEHIIFDGRKHYSVIGQQALRERSFIISSFGKTFHTTGWKIGYCLAPASLTAEFRRIHQFVTFSTSTPMQWALADFLGDSSNYSGLPDFYKQKRDRFKSLIQTSRFKLLPCAGTYFQLLSFEDVFEEGDFDLAIKLTKDIGVASIPVSVFYHNKTDNKVLRFCFAKEDSTLEQAAERLCKI